MMFDPTIDSTPDHPYRAVPPVHAFDPEHTRVPYDGQTRMRLSISSGLADARIVIDPAARDLVAVECGEGRRPRIRVAAGEVALRWHQSFGDWLHDVLTAGRDDVAIVLHPAVEWTIAIRGGLSNVDCELAAGAVARIDLAGGCSDVRFDLPLPSAAVPIAIAGGASHVAVRRPADTGVTVAVGGGLATLRLDDRGFDAIGGAVRLDAGHVDGGAPHYALSIRGGASDLAIERR